MSNHILGRRYALCVGIGTYTNLTNRNLRYAVADVTAIAKQLADPQRGNFVVTVLTEPTKTSKAALEEALDELLNAPDRQAQDLAVIYFSCHGDIYTADNTFCLLPSNTALQGDGIYKRTTLYSVYDLAKLLSGAKVHNIVVFLDVCHSGGAGVALQHLNLDLRAGPNLFIIGAARHDQTAMQSSLLEHGLFTHCLLRAFEQPPTKDGWLTISQIHSFISDAIPWYAKDHPIQIQGWSVSVNPNLPLLRNPGYSELCPLPPLWTIPLQRNPFFTGQEDILAKLATMLQREQKTALVQPQAISGLGGIGKTQLAIEYAYRYRQNYHAVLWVRADSRAELISSFRNIALLLELPEKDEEDPLTMVKAVKEWLAGHSKWLLILDNADELVIVKEFIPPAFQGHLLLTTRAQVMGGLAHKLEVEAMQPEIGALLLLRRTGLLVSDALLEVATPTEVTIAKELAKELGGLPLAIDQAGAYLEEVACTLQEYWQLYQTRQAELLAMRGGIAPEHPQSVVTTFSLAFQKLEQTNPTAINLLRLFAFLHPDAIPEELITQGCTALDLPEMRLLTDPLVRNAVLKDLQAYSLIQREINIQSFSLHRLVQVVLKDSLDEQTKNRWAQYTIQVVNAVFPSIKAKERWELRDIASQCDRFLPHVLICADLIDKYRLTIIDAARLLRDAAQFMALKYSNKYSNRIGNDSETANSQRTELLLKQSLTIYEQQLGLQHPDALRALENLASFYGRKHEYEQGEPLYQRILSLREQQLGLGHPDTRQSAANLSEIYWGQGKYVQAVLLYMQEGIELPSYSHIQAYLNPPSIGDVMKASWAKAENPEDAAGYILQALMSKETWMTEGLTYGFHGTLDIKEIDPKIVSKVSIFFKKRDFAEISSFIARKGKPAQDVVYIMTWMMRKEIFSRTEMGRWKSASPARDIWA